MAMKAGGARAVGACAALAVVVSLFAHVDDPKLRDRMPPYKGPGYKKALDGVKGGPATSTPPAGGGGLGPGGLGSFDSEGVSLASWFPLGDFGPEFTSGSDCWGYVSPSGREYAIIGLSHGTGFVEITDPDDAEIIEVHSGPTSLWRDIETYGTWAYAVTEGSGAAIQVFDLSNIDSGVVPSPVVVNEAGSVTGTDTHTVAVDTTSGFLFRCGGASNIGLRIYDLSNPASPNYVAEWHDRYVHDARMVTYTQGAYAGREIAFCCSGFNNGGSETGIDVLDVTDKEDILQLARIEYPNNAYSHQVWLTPDWKYLYLNDELDEGGGVPSTTHVIDITDPGNPLPISTFTNGNIAITHNNYVRDNLFFGSNYRSGIRIFDMTLDPLSPHEIAYFDTFPDDDDPSFNGLWANYPLFPSGTVIGSDLERGLWVWRVPANLLTFTYPLGRPDVVDPGTPATITVSIAERTAGDLAVGTPSLYSNIGAGWSSSSLTSLGGGLYEGTLPAAPCGTEFAWYVSAMTSQSEAVTSPGAAPAKSFASVASLGESIAIEYDMEVGTGWTATVSGATAGGWARGVPVNDPDWEWDPAADGDGSGAAWLTQNALGNTDVDGGSVILTSPAILLGAEPTSIAYMYYVRLSIGDGLDRLLVQISTNGAGGPWTQVALHDADGGDVWREHEITPSDLAAAGVPSPSTITLRFTANDANTQSLVEAGLDDLRLLTLDCAAPCSADLDESGDVGFSDLTAMLLAWGPCPALPEPCPEDLDESNDVGFGDLTMLLLSWGPCS